MARIIEGRKNVNKPGEHEEFMRRAIYLSEQAVKHGNRPFGALLVKDGKIILEVENTDVTDRDVTRHAELKLVSQACQLYDADTLAKCTLYTSTEPCPMCTGAIFWSGIPRIVFGCSSLGLRSVLDDIVGITCGEILARGKRDIELIGPILEDEAIEVHKGFWKWD